MDAEKAKSRFSSMTRNLQSLQKIVMRYNFPQTEHYLVTWLNWYLTISSGTFLVLFGTLNSFVIQEKLPLKWVYLSALASCGCSVVLLGVARVCLLTRTHNFSYLLELLDKALAELNQREPNFIDLPKDLVEKFALSGDALSLSQSLLRGGMSLFLIAFVLTWTYVFWYILVHL